jgi:hypothetical protein
MLEHDELQQTQTKAGGTTTGYGLSCTATYCFHYANGQSQFDRQEGGCVPT